MPKAAQESTFTIRMQQQVDRAASAAEGALARLERQIGREQEALGRLETSLVQAKAKLAALKQGDENGVVDINAYRKQESAVASLTARIGAQKDKIGALTEKFQNGGKSAQSLTDSAKALGGELGVTGSKAEKLIGMLAQMPPWFAAVAAGVLLWSAALSATIAVIWKGIGASGGMRDEMLKLQTATVYSAYGFGGPLFNGLRASRTEAEQMQATVSRLSGAFGGTRAELADYAVEARKAGFHGKQFDTVLRAMAVAHTGGSKGMASQFLAMARDARFFGRSIDDLAKRVDQKFGDLASKKMLSLDNQLESLGKNITYIFSGADVEPFLRGLRAVLSLFDADSASANSLRDVVTRLVEKAIGLFLDLEIAILKTYIWLRTHETAWKAVKLTIQGVGVIIGIFAAAVVVAMALVGIAVLSAALPFIILGTAIALAYTTVKSHLEEWKTIGTNIIDGIVEGIKSAPGKLIGAMGSMLDGAVAAAKKRLGIASPSKVAFMQIGAPFTAGVAGGISARASMVETASYGVVEAAMAPANSNALVSPMANMGTPIWSESSSSSAPVVHFENCSFGSGKDDVKRQVLSALEESSYAAEGAA